VSTVRAGPLSRATALVYTLLVVELLFLLATAPGLVLVVLLDRDASNLPLVAVAALPAGPALSAAVYALRRRGRDLADLAPAAAFLRGYRMNLRGVLAIWLPWAAWTTVLAVNLAYHRSAGVPGWWATALVVLALLATLWLANALVITSLYAFRARDVARLAGYFLIRTPGATLGNAGLLILATVITVSASEAVLALLGSLFAAALLRTCAPMLPEIEGRFTA
jgi:uncharacterized membrane protein YesL